MFWLLLAIAIVGTTVTIAGRFSELAQAAEVRRIEEQRLKAKQKILGEQAGLFIEQAALIEEGTKFGLRQKTREALGIVDIPVDIAAERIATAAAGTAARGLEPGASYEAVVDKFSRTFESAMAGKMEQRSLLTKTGGLQADWAAWQSRAAQADVEAIGGQLELLRQQEDWAATNLGLNIVSDILQGGMSFMTYGTQFGLFGSQQKPFMGRHPMQA